MLPVFHTDIIRKLKLDILLVSFSVEGQMLPMHGVRERISPIAETFRNAQLERGASKQATATYQWRNNTHGDTHCQQGHKTEQFRYPRIQD